MWSGWQCVNTRWAWCVYTGAVPSCIGMLGFRNGLFVCLFNNLFKLATWFQSPALLDLWGGINGDIRIHPHKGPVMRKAFPCHNIIMIWTWYLCVLVYNIHILASNQVKKIDNSIFYHAGFNFYCTFIAARASVSSVRNTCRFFKHVLLHVGQLILFHMHRALLVM